MANALVQLRVEDSFKDEALEICRQLGIDLPGYLRICIVRLVQEKGIPFPMKLTEERVQRAKEAIRQANTSAFEQGLASMSLDEINEEIAACRREGKNV